MQVPGLGVRETLISAVERGRFTVLTSIGRAESGQVVKSLRQKLLARMTAIKAGRHVPKPGHLGTFLDDPGLRVLMLEAAGPTVLGPTIDNKRRQITRNGELPWHGHSRDCVFVLRLPHYPLARFIRNRLVRLTVHAFVTTW